MQVFNCIFMRLKVLRFAVLAGACFLLAGCGSINIPLGSLMGGSSNDEIATGSIAPKTQETAVTSAPLPTADIKTAAVEPAGKPFTLEAPASEPTSSIENGSKVDKSFDKEDHAAVLAVLKEALPEKGSANSQAWSNGNSGYSGMVVPMAHLTKAENSNCRDLLISYGKDRHKEWYKAEGCRSGGNNWRLSDVTPWRKTR